jgi:hypothetical protein
LLTARLSVVESAKNIAAKIASLGIVLSEIFAPSLNSGSDVPFPHMPDASTNAHDDAENAETELTVDHCCARVASVPRKREKREVKMTLGEIKP